MAQTEEFAIRLEFRHGDGRCYISSPDLAGLHLAGSDMEALRADLEPVIKDLVFYGLNKTIGAIRFIPSLDEIEQKYRSLHDSEHTEVCLVELAA